MILHFWLHVSLLVLICLKSLEIRSVVKWWRVCSMVWFICVSNAWAKTSSLNYFTTTTECLAWLSTLYGSYVHTKITTCIVITIIIWLNNYTHNVSLVMHIVVKVNCTMEKYAHKLNLNSVSIRAEMNITNIRLWID